jgi:hypothetical protein
VAHYGLVRHRIPYFCGACTGAPQNAYFCGEDFMEHHPCATECIYECATEEVFPTSILPSEQSSLLLHSMLISPLFFLVLLNGFVLTLWIARVLHAVSSCGQRKSYFQLTVWISVFSWSLTFIFPDMCLFSLPIKILFYSQKIKILFNYASMYARGIIKLVKVCFSCCAP